MNTDLDRITRLKRIAFLFGTLGFLASFFLGVQNLWAVIRTIESKTNSNILFSNSGGFTVFEDMGLRYFIISTCFLLSIVFLYFRHKTLKLINLIPLAFIIHHCKILIRNKSNMLEANWSYSNWLETTYYIDSALIALAIVLIVINTYFFLFDGSFNKAKKSAERR